MTRPLVDVVIPSHEKTSVDNYKKCTVCGEVKPISEFYRRGRNEHGYRNPCKRCCAQKYKKPRKPPKVYIDAKTKICRMCGEMKPTSEFYRCGKGRRGYRSLCKMCCAQRYKRPHKERKTSRVYIGDDRKVCPSCHMIKDKSEYGIRSTQKMGIANKCLDCQRRYYDEVVRYRKGIVKKVLPYIDANTKICGKCGVAKPIDAFSHRKDASDGRNVYCKECINRDSRQWYMEHAESIREAHRAYSKTHRHIFNAAGNRRKAREVGADGTYSGDEFIALCAKYGNRCLCCGGEGLELHADHIVPLADRGSNSIDNIQPLCKRCNSSKGTKTIDYRSEWDEAKRTSLDTSPQSATIGN